MAGWLTALLLGLAAPAAVADVRVTDDAGHAVVLAAPATRVVSLGPHLTELAYAAGGGSAVVGVIRYSDFPDAARKLPIVGDAHAIDFERIVQLKPDLVLVWGSGLNERHKARLRSLGLTVFESEIRQAQGIPDTLRRLGSLLGHADMGDMAARRFESQWRSLAERHKDRPPVRVFWQLWHEPLMTINREHLISEAMRMCGGVNVFADLPLLTPSVSWEAAIAADPQLIAGSGRKEDAERDFAVWRRLGKNVGAVKRQRFALVDGSLIGRMGPRFVEGAAALCDAIETARQEQ
jgi:iron complex transport system substrate-binding protein